MKVIRVKKKGKIVHEATINVEVEKPARMRIAKQAPTMRERALIERPERQQLTKRQWQERGELLRSIKRLVPDIVGIDRLSLRCLQDVYRSTEHCGLLRTKALYI